MNFHDLCLKRNQKLKAMVRKPKINLQAMHDQNFRDNTIKNIAQSCEKVLDFGKSSRDSFAYFSKDQIKTADIVEYEGYPDIYIDICDVNTFPEESFDACIFLAILEHVYAPHEAVNNIYNSLNPGGIAFCYAPFLYRYHAPSDLSYQDYFRYSIDGLSYLFRNFKEVEIFPVRGRVSTAANLFGFYKVLIERYFGFRINKIIDSIASENANIFQSSGYYVLCKK